MTSIDLEKIAREESDRVEWKRSVADEEDVAATICAFANDIQNIGGGSVVCGAEETTDAHGFQSVTMVGLDGSDLKRVHGKVLDLCRDCIDPPIVPCVETIDTDDPARRVLVFDVIPVRQAHSFRRRNADGGKHYVRQGNRTIEARNGLLRELLRQKGGKLSWGEEMPTDASLDDIDLLAARQLLVDMKLSTATAPVEPFLKPEAPLAPGMPSLMGRDARGAIRPRRFFLLLCGRQPQRWAPMATAVCARLEGTDIAARSAQRLDIGGRLLEQIKAVMDFVAPEFVLDIDQTEVAAPNTRRYSESAVKEAVVNAFAHRDYEIGEPVRIHVFTDRIEIVSPGGLPQLVSVEDFATGKARANWRNPALAVALRETGWAQNMGRGITTLIEQTRALGGTTSLTVEQGFVVATIRGMDRAQFTQEQFERTNALIDRQRYDKALEMLGEPDLERVTNLTWMRLFSSACQMQIGRDHSRAIPYLNALLEVFKENETVITPVCQVQILETLLIAKHFSEEISDFIQDKAIDILSLPSVIAAVPATLVFDAVRHINVLDDKARTVIKILSALSPRETKPAIDWHAATILTEAALASVKTLENKSIPPAEKRRVATSLLEILRRLEGIRQRNPNPSFPQLKDEARATYKKLALAYQA